MNKNTQQWYAIILLLVLFVVSYQLRGIIFYTDDQSSRQTLQPGVHQTIKKSNINIDRTATVDNNEE